MTTIARFISLTTLLCVAFACSGCGLLYLPRIETSPGNFDRIEVRDRESGELIPEATIDYYLLNVT